MNNKRKSKQKYPITSLVIIFIVLAVVTFAKTGGSGEEKPTKPVNVPANDGQLVVHFLDVGQGDCEFIELPDNKCMLIDASEREYADKVIESIESYGYSRLDYVVATHPHSDHIGAMGDVINHFDVGNVYMPKASSNTKTFERMLNAISDKGLKINTAKAGKNIYNGDGLSIDIIAPVDDKYDDLNNSSAVVKITYGENKFLFMGDAEKPVENKLLDSYYDLLDCDVLKVGHHGSSSSSSMNFLKAATPDYAIISCGEGNSYGHPHTESLSRLRKSGAVIYRTDFDGTITVTCNGKDNIEVVCDSELDN